MNAHLRKVLREVDVLTGRGADDTFVFKPNFGKD